jgi:hypothetical protein
MFTDVPDYKFYKALSPETRVFDTAELPGAPGKPDGRSDARH